MIAGEVVHKYLEVTTLRALHDLRRSFLTMREKLDVPPYVLKRLINHSLAKDMTGQYIVQDNERLRQQMSRITNSFLQLIEVDCIGIVCLSHLQIRIHEAAEAPVTMVVLVQLKLRHKRSALVLPMCFYAGKLHASTCIPSFYFHRAAVSIFAVNIFCTMRTSA